MTGLRPQIPRRELRVLNFDFKEKFGVTHKPEKEKAENGWIGKKRRTDSLFISVIVEIAYQLSVFTYLFIYLGKMLPML
jgi:hypothetical protein